MLVFLLECRRRAFYTLGVFLGCFLLCFYYANPLLLYCLKPLINALPNHQGLIATKVTSAVFIPLKLAFEAALLLTLPFLLIQIWVFIAPALYLKEKIYLRGTLFASLILFFSGLAFCYYLVLPYLFLFFNAGLPYGVQMLPDIVDASGFVLYLLLVFGLSFQIPLLCFLLAAFDFVSLEQIKMIRPYVIVGAFIVGMVLTPPDVMSQIALAVPLCLLYELGILAVHLRARARERARARSVC